MSTPSLAALSELQLGGEKYVTVAGQTYDRHYGDEAA